MKLGLCLSGGGIRCAAQIGVIRALEEEKIKIEALSGTSAGSIVAALYATGHTPREMQEIFTKCGAYLSTPRRKIGYAYQAVTSIWRKPFGLLQAQGFEKMLDEIFARAGATGMATVAKPLAIPAVDIKSQQLVLFVSDKNGFSSAVNDDCVYYSDTRLSAAVRASCALPVVFTPSEIHTHTLVDGGLRLNVPVFPLRVFGCDKVLAVDMSCMGVEPDAADSPYKLISRTIDIMSHGLSNMLSSSADVRLDIDLCEVGLLSLNSVEACVEAGYKTAKRQMNRIITELY